MKTKVLLLIMCTLFTSNYLFSQKKELTHKTEHNELGMPVTVTSYDSRSFPVMKTVYTYHETGSRESKILYIWNKDKNNWMADSKTEYYYNDQNQLRLCSYKKWNSAKREWSDEAENMVYTYGENGNLLAIKKLKTNKYNSQYLTQN